MEGISKQNTTPHTGYETLFAALPSAVFVYDPDGRLTFFNPAAASLLGKISPVDEMFWDNLNFYDPYGKALSKGDIPAAIALREQRQVKDVEIIIGAAGGIQKYVICNARPVFDSDGRMTGVVETMQDITDREIEKEIRSLSEDKYKSLSELLEQRVNEHSNTLRESEERYHKMIEEVQDYAILMLDPDGYVLNWNLGAEKIKGYTEAEIIGKNFRLFYLNHDRENKLPEKLIQLAHETGRATHEGWRLRKDGTTFWGAVVITALHDDNGDIIGFSKVTRDLTERKLADDRMRNYALEIEFRNKQLEEYAYIASHDLQEPLRKIQIFSEMLEANADNEQSVRKNIEKINSAAKRMSSLIKDVLQYSQLSRADELFADVDLNTVIETIKEDFELLIEQKNAQIIHNTLPALKGIPIQLHQLLANLINNALKFTPEKALIKIHSREADAAELKQEYGLNTLRRYAVITVKDNGTGFEQRYGEQVFKMFKRLTDNSGTGIGLALCKKIVENHNGHIEVASEPGKGTEFTIFLPVN